MLGNWVPNQRCAYNDQRTSGISDERVAILEENSGWMWGEKGQKSKAKRAKNLKTFIYIGGI